MQVYSPPPHTHTIHKHMKSMEKREIVIVQAVSSFGLKTVPAHFQSSADYTNMYRD